MNQKLDSFSLARSLEALNMRALVCVVVFIRASVRSLAHAIAYPSVLCFNASADLYVWLCVRFTSMHSKVSVSCKHTHTFTVKSHKS